VCVCIKTDVIACVCVHRRFGVRRQLDPKLQPEQPHQILGEHTMTLWRPWTKVWAVAQVDSHTHAYTFFCVFLWRSSAHARFRFLVLCVYLKVALHSYFSLSLSPFPPSHTHTHIHTHFLLLRLWHLRCLNRILQLI